MKQIDFSASYFTWLTKKEASYGRFQIESACTSNCFNLEEEETYYLATAVIAGNVYAKNDLVKQPVYQFQIAASKQRHMIFRTFVFSPDDQNSLGDNSELFKEVELHIIKKEAVALKDFDDIAFHFFNHSAMTACICYEIKQNRQQIEIEFPVKHINIQRENRLFQVETGPILIPSEIPPSEKLSEVNKQYYFSTAFIHFNRLDCAEIALNMPTCVGKEIVYFTPHVKEINAKIVLMACNEKCE